MFRQNLQGSDLFPDFWTTGQPSNSRWFQNRMITAQSSWNLPAREPAVIDIRQLETYKVPTLAAGQYDLILKVEECE